MKLEEWTNRLYHFKKLHTELLLRKNKRYWSSKYQVYHLSRDRDYYTLIEYPKCGRTWLRFMICQAETIKYQVPLINTVHDICYEEYSLPRLYYIHGFHPSKPFTEYFHKNLFNKYFTEKGYVFMIRNPIDVMVSYFYQCTRRDKVYEGVFHDFVRDPHFGIKKFVEYIDFYYPLVKKKHHVLLKYENLITNTLDELTRILTFIELELDERHVREIIDNSEFSKMRKHEEKNTFNVPWLRPVNKNDSQSYKTRKSGQGRVEDALTAKDTDYIKETCRLSKTISSLYDL